VKRIVICMKQSAGLLPFRPGPEVLIAHPGGPVWAKRNEGAWSIVKGELVTGEEGLEAALREFTEETGWPAPAGPFRPLGETRLPSGKLIMAWAFADPVLDPTTLRPERPAALVPRNRPSCLGEPRQGQAIASPGSGGVPRSTRGLPGLIGSHIHQSLDRALEPVG
jgi:8-oxo-dGTP pyrophosphatase MutT (NUDIX family)